jgi:Protein of unknown function (DUF4230)
MIYPLVQEQAEPQIEQPVGRRVLRQLDKRSAAKHGGGVLGVLIGGLLRSMVAKLIFAVVLALLTCLGVIAKVGHLSSPAATLPGLATLHSTISVSAVMTKLDEIEQAHVATASYQVNEKIAQSVGIIPCWLICNQMQLQGTGTDDAIVDLRTLSPSDVAVSADRSSVTLWMPLPTIGPAVLDPAQCDISSSHGIVNTLTQGLHNNPNGYRPLFVEGESQIHSQAMHDPRLLAAAEQSTREMLARILGTIGARHVSVNFV